MGFGCLNALGSAMAEAKRLRLLTKTRMTPDQYKNCKCLDSFKLSNGQRPVIPPQWRPTAKNNLFDQQAKTNLESATRNQNLNLGHELIFCNHLKLKPRPTNQKIQQLKQNHEEGPKI